MDDEDAPEDQIDAETMAIGEVLDRGAEFAYTYDFGDGWEHACTVLDEAVDPIRIDGKPPATPLPYTGWGTIPDQYGRLTEDG